MNLSKISLPYFIQGEINSINVKKILEKNELMTNYQAKLLFTCLNVSHERCATFARRVFLLSIIVSIIRHPESFFFVCVCSSSSCFPRGFVPKIPGKQGVFTYLLEEDKIYISLVVFFICQIFFNIQFNILICFQDSPPNPPLKY